MTVEWTSTHIADFDDEALERIIANASVNRWDDEKIINEIEEECREWEDCDYYALNEEATNQILEVIHKRMGGYQISMFDKEDEEDED